MGLLVDRIKGLVSVTSETDLHRRLPTYQLDIGVVAAGAGYAAEIYPTGKRTLYITEVHLNKPSAAITIRLIKARSRSTGGTSTTPTPVPLDSAAGPAEAEVKLFTAVPTAGSAVGDVFDLSTDIGDIIWQEYGNHGTQPIILRGTNEALGVNVSGAATIAGYIRWMEG